MKYRIQNIIELISFDIFNVIKISIIIFNIKINFSMILSINSDWMKFDWYGVCFFLLR